MPADRKEYPVLVAFNNCISGVERDQCDVLKVNGVTFVLQAMKPRALHFVPPGFWLGRRRYRSTGWHVGYGNQYCTATWTTWPEAKRLMRDLKRSGVWSIEDAPPRLEKWWNAKESTHAAD